jgi:hypothetical protein
MAWIAVRQEIVCRPTVTRWITGLLVICAAVAASQSLVRADGAPPVGEFEIGKDGRFLIVPAAHDGKELLCLVDTGASVSAFDVSLRDSLGEPRGHKLLKTPGGFVRREMFDWPDVRLGDSSLRSRQHVICLDLSDVRHATNSEIYGVIGMDILKSSLMQVDFDAGRLRFLKALPADRRPLGEPVAMPHGEGGTPQLIGRIGAERFVRFVIDTGAQGNSVEAELFDELADEGLVGTGRTFVSVTIAGELRGQRGRLSDLTIGPFTQRGLRVSRINLSSVGLRYFSRFQTTFDFPAERVYLRRGAGFERPEPAATSGTTIIWDNGEPTIETVRPKGAGARAGLAPLDVLVRVNGRPAREFDPFALRELFTSTAGLTIPLQVRRAGQEFSSNLVLEED